MGAPEIQRAYAYLPDFARAAAILSKADDLPVFADIPFPGHNFSINDLVAEIERQTNRRLEINRFPWWALRLSAPFWELGRELFEQRYLYDHSHSLDGACFESLCSHFDHTPLEKVIARLIQLHTSG